MKSFYGSCLKFYMRSFIKLAYQVRRTNEIRFITALLLFLGAGLFFSSTVRGDALQPREVLIVGNSQVPESLALAKFYAAERQIPSQNILMLPLPIREEISRDQYVSLLAKPIRSFLEGRKLQNKIKVLVTMYGVPLKVGAATPTFEQKQMADEVKRGYFSTFSELEKRYGDLMQMAKGPITPNQPTTLPGRQNIDDFSKDLPFIGQKIEGLYPPIVSKIQQTKDVLDQNKLAGEFGTIRLDVEGQGAFVQAIMAHNQTQGEKLAAELRAKERELFSLQGEMPERRDLKKTYQLARELGGLILQMKTMHDDYSRLMQSESGAAVDSELSLVLWKEYPLAGKIPNGLNPRFKYNPMIADQGPILMVSRLDGPTPETVKRVIRDSVAVEAKGLSGKVYLDARGIQNKDGFYVYDENIRSLANLLKSYTKFSVTLDDKAGLFPPNSCPDTALYCGWYSLKNYIPAFTFVPGSVGYHIASFEATTLRHPKTNEWVKRMLENGVAATIGAVDEPYLDSFPLPTEFFSLLLTGQDTLVEVYYKTSRYNSWRMILIGDPLYRPFARNAPLTEKNARLQPLNLLLLN